MTTKSKNGQDTAADNDAEFDGAPAASFDTFALKINHTNISSSAVATPKALQESYAPAATAPTPISQAIAAMVSSVAAPATVPVTASVSSSPTLSSTSAAISPTPSTTAAPAWVSKLSTASLAADMAAADVNGTVSYAGLKTLLTDLDTTLANSKTTLTSAEFADLKTIAANLNNGMSTSSYLTSVMNAIVNGSTENKTWTGGAAKSITLGNLAVGSSATQLSDLIGKWVLGTDLPSSSVSMDGQSFSVTYSTSSNAVFGAAGPSMNDINQGYLGDCYLLSSLAEVAKQDAGDITSMFTSNGNNTYGIRFYVGGVADYITVNTSLADGGNVFNSATDIWASLAEKAYAQLQAAGPLTGNSINDGNSWSTIGNGGAPEEALEEITGATAITDFRASGSNWSSVVYNQSFGVTGSSSGNATAAVLSTLASDLAKGDDAVLSSWTNAYDSSGRQTLVASHAMSIYGYDSTTGMVEIRNPWGTEAGQTWDTTFEVSLTTLLADGDTITVDNAGTGTAPPTLTAQTAAQTWKLGQSVNFSLAANTFTDPQSQKLSYSATLSSGAALPSWLTFNGTTGTFSGTVPNTAAGLSIKVTATDTSGLQASEIFAVATPAAAPVLAAQTAAQSWTTGQAVNLALAATTFSDPQKEALTYSATQANGAALPTWLRFNGTTDTFSGTAPSAATSLSLKVTATDTSGLSVSETFAVTVAAAKMAGAIASVAGTGAVSSTLGSPASVTAPTLASPLH